MNSSPTIRPASLSERDSLSDIKVRVALMWPDFRRRLLDDPELITWQNYTARAWPTLVLVDPNGYIVAQYSGEGHAHALDALLGVKRPPRKEGWARPKPTPARAKRRKH